MSKRWTLEEDRFLHSYFDAVGDFIGTHDLGRPKGAATKRVKHLRATGAWDALTRECDAARDYRKCLGIKDLDDKEQENRDLHDKVDRGLAAGLTFDEAWIAAGGKIEAISQAQE